MLFLAASIRNLEIIKEMPRVNAVLGFGLTLALVVAGVIANRRINDRGRKSRYCWMDLALILGSVVMFATGVLVCSHWAPSFSGLSYSFIRVDQTLKSNRLCDEETETDATHISAKLKHARQVPFCTQMH